MFTLLIDSLKVNSSFFASPHLFKSHHSLEEHDHAVAQSVVNASVGPAKVANEHRDLFKPWSISALPKNV